MKTSTPNEIYDSAVNEYVAGDVEKALEKFRSLLLEQSEDLEGQPLEYWVGACYVGLQEFESAVLPLENALREAPHDCHPLFQFRLNFCLGSSYYYVGQLKLARKYLEKANEFVEHVSEDYKPDLFEFHFRLGRTYFDLKLYSKALIESKLARDILPYSTGPEKETERDMDLVRYDIGMTHYFLEEFDEAIQTLSKLIEEKSNDESQFLPHFYIGRSLRGKKQYTDALLEFKICEASMAQDFAGPADLFLDIAQCLYLTTQFSEARNYIKKSLQSKTTTDWVHDAARNLLKEIETQYH